MGCEYEVEIDGEVFAVRRVSSMERFLKEDENLTAEQAELIARAFLLAESMFEDEKRENYSENHITETTTETERRSITEREVFFEKIKEKLTERTFEKPGNEISGDSFDVSALAEFSDIKNYRQKVEELSRYLQRDNRRFEEYFEMY